MLPTNFLRNISYFCHILTLVFMDNIRFSYLVILIYMVIIYLHTSLSVCSRRLHYISSLDVIISKHMLKMAWQPLRKPKQITAKQSTDFPHNSVYSPRNHVDTYFSNMSGTGSHKWVWKQTQALKYDVDLQRLHHKRGKRTQASCVSAKSDGRGVKKKNVWVEETLRNRRNDVYGFLFTAISVENS